MGEDTAAAAAAAAATMTVAMTVVVMTIAAATTTVETTAVVTMTAAPRLAVAGLLFLGMLVRRAGNSGKARCFGEVKGRWGPGCVFGRLLNFSSVAR